MIGDSLLLDSAEEVPESDEIEDAEAALSVNSKDELALEEISEVSEEEDSLDVEPRLSTDGLLD